MKQWIISGVIGAAAYAALIWVFALLTGQDYSGWMVIIYAWVPFLCREEKKTQLWKEIIFKINRHCGAIPISLCCLRLTFNHQYFYFFFFSPGISH